MGRPEDGKYALHESEMTAFPSTSLSRHATLDRRRFLWTGAALLAGCGGGGEGDSPPALPSLQVSFEGLSGLKVARLRSSPQGTLAVTNNGLFGRTGQGWQPLGLAGRELVDVAVTSRGRIVASSRLEGMFESSNLGASWQPMISNFGGATGPETAWALLADGDRLLATTGYGFAESRDEGRNWTLRVGQWSIVSTGMPALTVGAGATVWFGGQNAIEQLVLGRWSGSSLQEWDRLMPSPSVVTSVRLVAAEPQRALVCGEGGIIQTRDGGRSWTPVFVNNVSRFYFDVLPDPSRPGRWVSAGYSKTDAFQPLRVAISDDDGASWRELEYPDNRLFGGVLSMNVTLEEGRSIFRFGLAGGGIARVMIRD